MTKVKVQLGEVYMDKVTQQKTIYPNKTRKYLLPCLKEYGEIFIQRLNNVFKVAVGIGDIIISKSGLKHEKHIFILLDSTIAPNYFLGFLNWIKDQPMYEDDYVYGNIQKSGLHMIVLKFPDRYYDSFETFKIGKYSGMYSQEVINNFFNNYPDTQKVFIGDHNYKIVFMQELNEWLNNTREQDQIKPEEWEGELDFPPDENETFNHHLKK